jgi:hypothetical protein
MIYTVRYAHLKEKPLLSLGQRIWPGDIIGEMGNTGSSTAAHLHIDCVEGLHKGRYSLQMMEDNLPLPSPRQLNYFIDGDLFKVQPEITTYYCDPEYQKHFKKVHPAYDVVPVDRHTTKAHYLIHWNRSMVGTVTAIYEDPTGYGICLYIAFEAA